LISVIFMTFCLDEDGVAWFIAWRAGYVLAPVARKRQIPLLNWCGKQSRCRTFRSRQREPAAAPIRANSGPRCRQLGAPTVCRGVSQVAWVFRAFLG
jgi:hypothetical protein